MSFTPSLPPEGTFLGRVWLSDVNGPAVVLVRDGEVYDITSSAAPTMTDLFDLEGCIGFLREVGRRRNGSLDAIAASSETTHRPRSVCSPLLP